MGRFGSHAEQRCSCYWDNLQPGSRCERVRNIACISAVTKTAALPPPTNAANSHQNRKHFGHLSIGSWIPCTPRGGPVGAVAHAEPGQDRFEMEEVETILADLKEREGAQIANYFAAAFFGDFRPSE